jgi:hypothetical protein
MEDFTALIRVERYRAQPAFNLPTYNIINDRLFGRPCLIDHASDAAKLCEIIQDLVHDQVHHWWMAWERD